MNLVFRGFDSLRPHQRSMIDYIPFDKLTLLSFDENDGVVVEYEGRKYHSWRECQESTIQFETTLPDGLLPKRCRLTSFVRL